MDSLCMIPLVKLIQSIKRGRHVRNYTTHDQCRHQILVAHYSNLFTLVRNRSLTAGCKGAAPAASRQSPSRPPPTPPCPRRPRATSVERWATRRWGSASCRGSRAWGRPRRRCGCGGGSGRAGRGGRCRCRGLRWGVCSWDGVRSCGKGEEGEGRRWMEGEGWGR